jgi:antitoxin (DNA-binding transcriptional repressor) of toxin-antitoxin stability system
MSSMKDKPVQVNREEILQNFLVITFQQVEEGETVLILDTVNPIAEISPSVPYVRPSSSFAPFLNCVPWVGSYFWIPNSDTSSSLRTLDMLQGEPDGRRDDAHRCA